MRSSSYRSVGATALSPAERTKPQTAVDGSSCSRLTSRRSPVPSPRAPPILTGPLKGRQCDGSAAVAPVSGAPATLVQPASVRRRRSCSTCSPSSGRTGGRPRWPDQLRIAKSTAHALLAELASAGLTERLAVRSLPARVADAGACADDAGDERVSRRGHADRASAGEPLR